MRRRHRRSDCPIHFALELFGDAWTLLIIRDLMFKGRTTYTGFLRAGEGIATNVLADRLVRLEEDGIIVKERDPARGSVNRYRLTSKGVDLLPILLEIIDWSAKYDPNTAADPAFVRQLRRDKASLATQLRSELVARSSGRHREADMTRPQRPHGPRARRSRKGKDQRTEVSS